MKIDKDTRILIVDDYKTMLRIIRNLLKQLGASDPNIDDAVDGSFALERLGEKDYDLIISDRNMEPMSGLQLLKEVRANVKLKEVPFIMIIAESKSENVIAAKEAGVSNYIFKPFNAATLKSKIESIGWGTTLKSCPFCGNEATYTYRFVTSGKCHRVECTKRFSSCPMNARTHHHEEKEDAAKAWNTRVIEGAHAMTAEKRAEQESGK